MGLKFGKRFESTDINNRELFVSYHLAAATSCVSFRDLVVYVSELDGRRFRIP